RRLHTPPPFPYTLLFRSVKDEVVAVVAVAPYVHQQFAPVVGRRGDAHRVTAKGLFQHAVQARNGRLLVEEPVVDAIGHVQRTDGDRKSTRLNSSHVKSSY